jgi:subtilisin family serine protease/streptogramin lyase
MRLRGWGAIYPLLLLVSLAACIVVATATGARAVVAREDSRIPGHYIVVLKDSVDHPGAVAQAQTAQRNGDLGFVYRHALEGYSATLPKDEVVALRRDPRVKYVTADRRVGIQEEEVELETEENEGVEIFEPTIPTGISRVFAPPNKALDIDGKDDLRADVDVAVIDTGIDYENPELNVVARTSCITGSCIDNSGKDGHSHGTHVAGTIGAIDNGDGVVGIASGARLWAVKALNDGGVGNESWIVAGVDWVTAHAKEIEVVNMSLGCLCSLTALDTAINKSVEAGVVYVVSAGNENTDAKFASPAKNPNVITVSALADYDGKPGAKSSHTCQNYGLDDRLASFSNYGASVDIIAPGVCILSTLPGKSYGYKSGTSMASPHVAGAAGVLAIQSNPSSKKDVEAIRETLVKAGNFEWTDTSGDGIQEPLLDVGNESIFKFSSPPINVTLPVPSPTIPLQAVPESTTNGTWTGESTSYAYQWQRCNATGGECVNISGATKSTYTPVEADVGKTLRITVTAKNAGGETAATSEATGKVTPIGQLTEYALPAGSGPWGITTGPDGKLWFTDYWLSKVGKITTAGAITEYALPAESQPRGITAGPDGNLWFANWFKFNISKITTSGAITKYSTTAGVAPREITLGPDGNLWFTAGSSGISINKITTSGVTTKYTTKAATDGIAAGPDGNLWFTQANNKISKITTAGAITEYALPEGSSPTGITAGPDGKLWFTNHGSSKIGKITTSGTITEYALPPKSGPSHITLGADGNLWYTNWLTDKIGRITTSGTITEYSTGAGCPLGITSGPDYNLWFTNQCSGKIGVIAP